jgi:hypothetical protein
MADALVTTQSRAPVSRAAIDKALALVESAREPGEIRSAEITLESFQNLMEKTGLYSAEEIFEVNHGRMTARWKLGVALKEVERAEPGPRGKENKERGLSYLSEQLNLTKPVVIEAQRMAALPRKELDKALEKAFKNPDGPKRIYFADLVKLARPYWYQESRACARNGSRLQSPAARPVERMDGGLARVSCRVIAAPAQPSRTMRRKRPAWCSPCGG